jgi:hypothetical protein
MVLGMRSFVVSEWTMLGFIRHSRAGGKPGQQAGWPGFELKGRLVARAFVANLDSRLRGNDNGELAVTGAKPRA